MALKFVQTGNAGAGGSGAGTYDHNLLVNRGLPDQHTIESITGLRTALNGKYEKPFSGIPKSDLAFNVATLHDIDVFRNTEFADVINDLSAIALEVYNARGGLETLKTYIDTKVPYSEFSGGSGGGGTGGHIDSQVGYPIYEEYKAIDLQTTFMLTKTYQMGTHQLEVYLNGLRMTENDDYTEVDDHTIEFLFGLEENDRVLFLVRAVINSGIHEEHIAMQDQFSFTLKNPYGIQQNILQVFRNGNLMRKGRDYRETDDRTVEFLYPLQKDDYITFHQSGATDPIAGTILESELGRMKINHGYTTMLLQEATKSRQTDFIDMYVDTFLDVLNIDEDASSPFKYEDESIEVNDLLYTVNQLAQFKEGNKNDVDILTYPNTVTLLNLSGGSEIHSFKPFSGVINAQLNEILPFVTNRKIKVTFYVEETVAGQSVLRVKSGTKVVDLNFSDGYFFSLSADQDSEGHIHLAYHEQGSALGHSRVHYLKLDAEELKAESHHVISDTTQDAITPDIVVDKDDNVHIVFASKRINAAYFNVDYRTIAQGVLSGFKDVTVYATSDALNPRTAVGKDNVLRIVFESTTMDNKTKNIRLVLLEDGIRTYADWITHSTTYPNALPDISMDAYDNLKIVWKSKRVTSEFGVDFCDVDTSNVVSPARTIASGSFTADGPRVVADHEGIAHIVFHANITRSDHDNIGYAYVYPDGSVSNLADIASGVGIQYRSPDLQIHGDQMFVGYLGDTKGYEAQKSLANYTGVGRFDYTFDSEAEGSSWQEIFDDVSTPAGTSYTVQYRLSDDKVIWSAWKDKSLMPAETETGRYIHMRVTLTSTDIAVTPSLRRLSPAYRPKFIEIQSKSKPSTKDVDSAILIAKYDGDVTFRVSRDAGKTFVETDIEKAVSLLNKPQGKEIVVSAKITDGSRLHAWGVLW